VKKLQKTMSLKKWLTFIVMNLQMKDIHLFTKSNLLRINISKIKILKAMNMLIIIVDMIWISKNFKLVYMRNLYLIKFIIITFIQSYS